MSAKRIGRIELGAIIGEGGFGRVYVAHDLDMNQDVAVKLVDKSHVKMYNLEAYVQREVEIMKMVRHPHVISLREMIDLPNSYCFVMEVANNGELFDRILESKRFDERLARKYFQQLMSAVRYCHSKGVVHRDLKAENLLLGEHMELKVCDFGLSRFAAHNLSDRKIVFTSIAGSMDYQAPEMWNSDGYSGYSCDVWSCGVILFFMLCGYLPFAAHTESETEERIKNGQYNKRDKNLSPEAADLISKILVPDVKERYTVADIIAHPWFTVDLDEKLFPREVPKSPGVSSPGVSSPGFSSPASLDDVSKKKLDEDAKANELVAMLHRAFDSVNVDHSGQLKRDEIRDVLIEVNNGNPVSDQDVSDVMACFELDPDGGVTREHFIAGWAMLEKKMQGKLPLTRLVNMFHVEGEKKLLTDLRKAFKRLDMNNSGVITADNVMAIEELNITQEEAEQIIKAMDKHNQNTVTFDDFVFACTKADVLRRHHICVRLQRLRELFDAVGETFSAAYVNSGFSVAGLRQTIQEKLFREGPTSACATTFTEGESGTYIHGKCAGKSLQVGVQLLPAASGYTKVLSYRIMGQTQQFHEWFQEFRLLLKDEIVKCQEDTSVCGESIEL